MAAFQIPSFFCLLVGILLQEIQVEFIINILSCEDAGW